MMRTLNYVGKHFQNEELNIVTQLFYDCCVSVYTVF